MSVSRMLLGQGPLPQQVTVYVIKLLVSGGPRQQRFSPAELKHGSDVSMEQRLFSLGSSEVAPLKKTAFIFLDVTAVVPLCVLSLVLIHTFLLPKF